MPSSIRYEPGAVVAVRIRFSDGSDVKRRPVVVLTDALYHDAHADAVVVALTTNLDATRFGDCMLADWGAAGLPRPSKAKGSLHTIERSAVEKQYGTLSAGDLRRLRESIKLVLGL
jgi:mRNA-degrading endonuclease toxin of MazEF toxin-antitoxin module